MAVFTPITFQEVQSFIADYDLPPMLNLSPIAAGTDNSNFILSDQDGQRYILTVFEARLNPQYLPAIFKFITAVKQNTIVAPMAYRNRHGDIIGKLKNKPAALIEFIKGQSHLKPADKDIQKMADLLAKMHNLSEGHPDGFDLPDNPLSLPVWQKLFTDNAEKIKHYDTDATAHNLITQALDHLEQNWPNFARLPKGAIHADAFPDNVFFDDQGKISGIIDFYFACCDYFVYDLMLTVNAWCFDQNGQINSAFFKNFLDHYQIQRPLSKDENEVLFQMGLAAALRILLTRFRDYTPAPKDHLFIPHDPAPYLKIVSFYLQELGQKDVNEEKN